GLCESRFGYPAHIQRALAGEVDSGLLGCRLDDHHGLGRSWQLFQTTADRRNGGLVTDQQVPVEGRRNDEGAPRPGNAQQMTGFGMGCPVRCGSLMMQYEVDIQLVADRIVAAWCVIAQLRLGYALGKHQEIGRASCRERVEMAVVAV